MKITKIFACILVIVPLVLSGITSYDSECLAKGGGGRGGSSSSRSASFGKNAGWSSSTQSTWHRSGGGILGSKTGSSSSGSYAKPSLNQTPTEVNTKQSSEFPKKSLGYSKPTASGSASATESRTGDAKSSAGYSKPSVATSSQSKISGSSTMTFCIMNFFDSSKPFSFWSR